MVRSSCHFRLVEGLGGSDADLEESTSDAGFLGESPSVPGLGESISDASLGESALDAGLDDSSSEEGPLWLVLSHDDFSTEQDGRPAGDAQDEPSETKQQNAT